MWDADAHEAILLAASLGGAVATSCWPARSAGLRSCRLRTGGRGGSPARPFVEEGLGALVRRCGRAETARTESDGHLMLDLPLPQDSVSSGLETSISSGRPAGSC